MKAPRLSGMTAVLLAASLCGCSLGLFSDGKDPSVLAQKPAHEAGARCGQVDFRDFDPRPGMEVGTFRSLVSCLDSNGPSRPLAELVEALSDDELAPIVRAAHEVFLKDPVAFFQFKSTFEQWKSGDTDLSSVAALIRTLSGAVSAIAPSSEAGAAEAGAALRIILGGLDAADVEGGLDALLAVVQSPAWKSLVARLSPVGTPDGGGRENSPAHSKKEIARAIHRYLRAQRTPGGTELDLRLLQAMASGRLFEAVDRFSMALSPGQDIRFKTSQLAALLHELVAPGGFFVFKEEAVGLRSLLAISRMAHVPVSCLVSGEQEGTTVPDALGFVLSEFAQQHSISEMEAHLGRGLPLQAALSGSFCSLPAELVQAYPGLRPLLASQHATAGALLMGGFAGAGLGPLAADALGGGAAGPSPLVELIPVLSELDSRGALEDLILLMGSIRVQDRKAWQRLARAWVAPRPELVGLSLHEALYDALIRSGSRGIEALLDSMSVALGREEPVLAPALTTFRRLERLNDVHPLIAGFKKLGATPGLWQELLSSLAQVIERRPQAFGQLLDQWLEGGRLTAVLESIFRIFWRQAERGAVAGPPVHALPVPVLDPASLRAHSYSRQDLLESPSPARREWNGCAELDPGIHLERHRSFGYGARLQAFLDCIASGTGERALRAEELIGVRLPSGGNIVGVLMDNLLAMKLSPAGARELVDVLGSLPAAGASLRGLVPLFKRAGPEARAILAGLETLAGRQLGSEHFPGAVAWVQKLAGDAASRDGIRNWLDDERFELEKFSGVLEKYECLAGGGGVSRRASELVEDYRQSVTSIDLPASSWDPGLLSERMGPVLAALAGNSEDGGLATALTSFLRRYSGREHELRDWLAEHANDWRVIPYFYPGEDRPRAKIINSMDAFELLAANADFEFMLSGNYATRFNTSIALAWGDEPRQNWPEAVRELFPAGRGAKEPKTLAEASEEILATLRLSEKYIGYPGLPDCSRGGAPSAGAGLFPLRLKARVFNMRQLVPVLTEGRSLRVMRDLLVELHSTPGIGREKNLVSISPKLAAIGGFRLLSRLVRLATLPGNGDPETLSGAIRGLVSASTEPLLIEALQSLGRKGGTAAPLLWSALAGSIDPEVSQLALDSLAVLRSPVIARGVLEQASAIFKADVIRGTVGNPHDPKLRGWVHALSRTEMDPSFELWVSSLLSRQPDGRWFGVEVLKLIGLMGEGEIPSWSEMGSAMDAWLELVSEQNPRAKVGGRELRQYLAEQLLRGKLAPWIEWMATNPATAARVIESVEKSSLPGEMFRLMQAASRAFSPRPGLTLDAQGLETRAHVHSSN